MTGWLALSFTFWIASLCLLGYVLWRTSKRRSWQRIRGTFVEWVEASVSAPSPPAATPEQLEEAVAAILDDVSPHIIDLRTPKVAGGVKWP